MRKLTTAAIGVACLVLGAGGATLYTHAATGPAFYAVYEANVTDEDAYKKALPDAQKIIKDAGGVYIAGSTKPRWITAALRSAIATSSSAVKTKPPTTSSITAAARIGSTRTPPKPAKSKSRVSRRNN